MAAELRPSIWEILMSTRRMLESHIVGEDEDDPIRVWSRMLEQETIRMHAIIHPPAPTSDTTCM